MPYQFLEHGSCFVVEKQKIRGKLKHHLFFTFTLYRATLVKNELVKNSSVKNGVFYFLLFTTIVNGLKQSRVKSRLIIMI